LLKAAARVLPDPRNPQLVLHTTEQLLRQRVFGLCQGYEDLNDHDRLRLDPTLHTALDKRGTTAAMQNGASSPTLCRFEARANRKAAVELHRVLIEQFIASFAEPPQELILDFDATDDLVHGEQDRRHFSAYNNNYCFLPLYVFCGEQLLVAYLRSAKHDAALHAVAIMKLLTRRLRQAWPQVRLVFAAIRDSAVRGCSAGANATASTTSSVCRRTRACWRWLRRAASRRMSPSSAVARHSGCSASSPTRHTRGGGGGASSPRPSTTRRAPTRASS
jgi:hypothetical protein